MDHILENESKPVPDLSSVSESTRSGPPPSSGGGDGMDVDEDDDEVAALKAVYGKKSGAEGGGESSSGAAAAAGAAVSWEQGTSTNVDADGGTGPEGNTSDARAGTDVRRPTCACA